MPIYAYECHDCGVRFDRRQGFNDPPLTVCPECEGSVHRLIMPAGIIFKGSGFYVTDNKSSKNPAAPSAHTRKESDAGEKKADAPAKADSGKASDSTA